MRSVCRLSFYLWRPSSCVCKHNERQLPSESHPKISTCTFSCLFTYDRAGFLAFMGFSSGCEPGLLPCSACCSVCVGFSLRGLLLLQKVGPAAIRPKQLQHAGLVAVPWASRVHALQLWCMSLVAPRNVQSSQTRARTCVSCVGRWILDH